jgi:hypothetical protein
MMRTSLSLLWLATAIACGGTHGAPDAGADTGPMTAVDSVGLACDTTHPCPNGTACGVCGIATGQCVLPCSASGQAGCPQGTWCSKAGSNRFWSGNYNEHFCVRMCGDDSDCKTPTGNAGLSCNDGYDDDDTSGPSICNVSNSIGSTHACPGP